MREVSHLKYVRWKQKQKRRATSDRCNPAGLENATVGRFLWLPALFSSETRRRSRGAVANNYRLQIAVGFTQTLIGDGGALIIWPVWIKTPRFLKKCDKNQLGKIRFLMGMLNKCDRTFFSFLHTSGIQLLNAARRKGILASKKPGRWLKMVENG